jgi:hypothetical protein
LNQQFYIYIHKNRYGIRLSQKAHKIKGENILIIAGKTLTHIFEIIDVIIIILYI